MNADVVVCGAGVGGLLCAHALAQRGHRVVLLEKQKQPADLAKGEVFQPGSLAVLRDLGLLHRLVARGAVEVDRLVVHDAGGERLLSFEYSSLTGLDKSLLVLGYTDILDVLTEALPESVSFHRGATVDEVLRDPSGGRVTGVSFSVGGQRRTVGASLVVAADGVSSRLRKLATISAHPVKYPHRLVSLELTGVPEWQPEVSAYMTGQGLRLAFPLPGGRLRLYAQVAPALLRQLSRAEFTDWCADLGAEIPTLVPLRQRLRESAGTRQVHALWRFSASRLTTPGMALVGESAHAFHPMAAQGMNTAVADAQTLAEQLAAGPLTAEAVDDALARYETQRRRWIRHIGVMSHEATKLVTSTSRAERLFSRHVLRRMGGNPRLRYIATHNLAGFGMRPFTILDRLHQVGLPDLRADRVVT